MSILLSSVVTGMMWVATGVIIGGVLLKFWDSIASWLNKFAGDYIERKFGYESRTQMYKAIAKIDRIVGKIKNTSVIYTKRHRLDTHFVKTEVIAQIDDRKINYDILEELDRRQSVVQEFIYK